MLQQWAHMITCKHSIDEIAVERSIRYPFRIHLQVLEKLFVDINDLTHIAEDSYYYMVR